VPAVAAAAFWGFVAVVVVAKIWREIVFRRETETTIRLAIEKGQNLDPVMVEKLLRQQPSGSPDALLLGGAVTLAAGVGLPIMGYFISLSGDTDAFYPLIGVGILVSLIGLTLLILSRLIRPKPLGAASDRLSA
jgi:hypothetical protein